MGTPPGMSSVKASMATKCIDQIPMPIATAPPASQTRWARPHVAAIRPANWNAVYDAMIAITTDSMTSLGSYETAILHAPSAANTCLSAAY